MSRARALSLCLLAVLATVAESTAALAHGRARVPAPLAQGTFSVTPSDQQIVARPPVALMSTTVSNTTRQTLRVRAIPVLVRQQRSGAFVALPGRAQSAAALAILVRPRQFMLPPGSRRRVAVTWRRRGRGSVYAGVIYRAVAAHVAGPVHTVEQLFTVDLLDRPGSHPARARLVGAAVRPGTDGRPQLVASVSNTGGRPAVLGASAVISSVGAPQLVPAFPSVTGSPRVRMAGGLIIPGAVRDLAGAVSRLPEGRYTALLRVGNRQLRRAFAVDATGRLVAPRLRIGRVSVQSTVNRAAVVTLPFSNTGTASGQPQATLAVYRLRAGAVTGDALASLGVHGSPLAPGQHATVMSRIGRLGPGTYELSVSSGAAAPTSVDFSAQPPPAPAPSIAVRLVRWVTGHVVLLLLGVALIACGGLGWALVRQGRRLRAHGPGPDVAR